MTRDELLDWARAEAARLQRRHQGAGNSGAGDSARPLAASALEFLRLHARGTEFYASALATFETRLYVVDALQRIASILEQWVEYVEAGLQAEASYETRARFDAATDLMEQVQVLLDDRSVHVAAPIVLAGAALEEALRGLVEQAEVTVVGKPGINTYATALQKEQLLTAQEVKDVTAWAGLRNDAAHGRFDDLRRDTAGLMVAGVNLFLQRRARPDETPVTTV